MKILFDYNHPAHVHLLKNLYTGLKNEGCDIISTFKTNDTKVRELLDLYNIPYTVLSPKRDELFFKILNQVKYNSELLKICRKKKIELAIGSSATIAHVSKFTNTKSIVLDDDDDDVEPLIARFGHPFCDVLLSPIALKGKRKKKDTIYYPGYHELAYLHPNRFTPDESVLEDSGLTPGEKYFVLRFNSFKAHHDIGVKGLSLQDKKELISLLEDHGNVFITTERETDPEFAKYKITIPPHKIHSFIYYAYMLIGDSQTMTSEAAVLGVPSVRCNSFVGRISYLEEQEHEYGLTFGFKPEESDKMFEKVNELLAKDDLKSQWIKKRYKLLEDKIDVTSFLLWFVKNYPSSVSITQNADATFWEQFR